MTDNFLLDTGILIELLRGNAERSQMVRGLVQQGGRLASCSMIVMEVFAGMQPREESVTERLIRSLRFYDVTWDIARLAGTLKNHWARNGRILHLPDVTIAAVAMTYKLVLVTNNPKDFPMPELQIYPGAGNRT
jgi:predicted nucleic acid-binding protein